MTSVTLAQAKQILAIEPIETERYALANSIVSLYAANEILTSVIHEDSAMWRERGRLLADRIREYAGENWEPSMIEGWQ